MKMLPTILKGMAMGLAEVIPGVSGGTIAFITGIYEKLLHSIKSLDIELLKLIFSGQWDALRQKIDITFLFFLILGMVLGVGVGIFGVSYIMEAYPLLLWSFFFGLIFVSVFYILSQIPKLQWQYYIYFFVGACIAGYISFISPASGSENPIYIILAGSIAICALILPGISGSFILLLMGMYTIVIPAVKSLLTSFDMASLSIVALFGLGCILGLALFSRILSWTFKHYRDSTLSLMAGFMLGSLIKIWPWRIPTRILKKEEGITLDNGEFGISDEIYQNENIKVLKEQLVLPADYFSDPMLFYCIICALIGGITVYMLWKFED